MMLNSGTLNSSTLNGHSLFDPAPLSVHVASRHTICPGRNRIKKRNRGTSVMIVIENKTINSTWILEAMSLQTRLAGRRRR